MLSRVSLAKINFKIGNKTLRESSRKEMPYGVSVAEKKKKSPGNLCNEMLNSVSLVIGKWYCTWFTE